MKTSVSGRERSWGPRAPGHPRTSDGHPGSLPFHRGGYPALKEDLKRERQFSIGPRSAERASPDANSATRVGCTRSRKRRSAPYDGDARRRWGERLSSTPSRYFGRRQNASRGTDSRSPRFPELGSPARATASASRQPNGRLGAKDGGDGNLRRFWANSPGAMGAESLAVQKSAARLCTSYARRGSPWAAPDTNWRVCCSKTPQIARLVGS